MYCCSPFVFIFLYLFPAHQLKSRIKKNKPDYHNHILVSISGAVLKALIPGWKKSEFRVVYSMVSRWYGIPEKVMLISYERASIIHFVTCNICYFRY